MKPTLFLLAAGMGSRYGGLKQLDGLGPNGETIMDYSIYDAIHAGFGKLVFVIRKDFEQDFRNKIISKYEGESEYVIYRNDFEAPASLDGLMFESGKDLCRWENGALVMDSTVFARNTVSILLPEMLSTFGSYRVEAVFSIEGIAAANSSFSLLFRAGDMNSPRCRLSVINKASYDDGISFETYSLSEIIG